MSKIVGEVVAANEAYVRGFGNKGELPLPPARRFAILTCMDARLDPAKYAGLAEGDAHVIRNAGGRATDDAIRSLVISHKLLGTQEWFVIHHTNCGMELFADEVIAPICSRTIFQPRALTARPGRTRTTTGVTRPATSSNGIRSRTSLTALRRTCVAFASIPWFPQTCLSMATSTTSELDGSTK